jgi:predicted lysophospholipase L1 biosynthesis ABC-type transport system permease subunit
MDVLYDWAPAILILGLVLAAVGAGVAARAVILTQLQADALASTQRNVNDALRDALLQQSRTAALGLGLVALGTIVQIAGTLIVVWTHLIGE